MSTDNVHIQDFIAVYSNIFPEGYCQHLIDEFERLRADGAGYNRQTSDGVDRRHKDDLQLVVNGRNYELLPFEGNNPRDMFFTGLQACYDHYVSVFSPIREGEIRANAFKMQRTDPGGGYHVWHCEQGGGAHANRVLVYMLYLNTLDEDAAGETEFLFQKRRVRPVENTMLIWPAAFTHAHRGNTVFGQKSKYVVTGWFYIE